MGSFVVRKEESPAPNADKISEEKQEKSACSVCRNRRLLPVTDEVVRAHLTGLLDVPVIQSLVKGKVVDDLIAEVLDRRGKPPVAIECKWKAGEFDSSAIEVFLRLHPEALPLVVCHDIDRHYSRRVGNHTVRFMNLEQLIICLQNGSK